MPTASDTDIATYIARRRASCTKTPRLPHIAHAQPPSSHRDAAARGDRVAARLAETTTASRVARLREFHRAIWVRSWLALRTKYEQACILTHSSDCCNYELAFNPAAAAPVMSRSARLHAADKVAAKRLEHEKSAARLQQEIECLSSSIRDTIHAVRFEDALFPQVQNCWELIGAPKSEKERISARVDAQRETLRSYLSEQLSSSRRPQSSSCRTNATYGYWRRVYARHVDAHERDTRVTELCKILNIATPPAHGALASFNDDAAFENAEKRMRACLEDAAASATQACRDALVASCNASRRWELRKQRRAAALCHSRLLEWRRARAHSRDVAYLNAAASQRNNQCMRNRRKTTLLANAYAAAAAQLRSRRAATFGKLKGAAAKTAAARRAHRQQRLRKRAEIIEKAQLHRQETRTQIHNEELKNRRRLKRTLKRMALQYAVERDPNRIFAATEAVTRRKSESASANTDDKGRLKQTFGFTDEKVFSDRRARLLYDLSSSLPHQSSELVRKYVLDAMRRLE